MNRFYAIGRSGLFNTGGSISRLFVLDGDFQQGEPLILDEGIPYTGSLATLQLEEANGFLYLYNGSWLSQI